ncbi:hypothetical protein G5C65_27730 [Streptomyces sp. SB3404]|uniref:Uncharacterized protein n=1 Tax=Streptomyces boncukensis TaxID=2711219 RepID=A0A6G4X4L4_9ACTN|nr:hypothetical protein [Streptomyces boncukensis]
MTIITKAGKAQETKVTERPVISACLPGTSFRGVGMSGVSLGSNERPTKALAVAATKAQVSAYAFAIAATGAGEGRQKTQRHPMWAFRGLEPWRDPA